MESISKAAFRRLPRYHQILSAFEALGREFISSRELSEILEINETLVRKDMADLKIRGKQNQGYGIGVLRKRIEDFLGLLEVTEALVVGAGHLGTALATYSGFKHYGLEIVGVLDNDPNRIGSMIGGHEVTSVFRLASMIQKYKVKLVILCVPKDVAQEITDIAVKAGVKAIWNFTPQELSVPDGVKVRNEQIIGGFMALSHFLKMQSLSRTEEGAA
ncbi:MAG TPA: redox-sensing transcriptional repressor Rex [Bacteroidota bacterium]|nr:redox-sensing transcriptional repressor Rex [Bacteroidota bacterium]